MATNHDSAFSLLGNIPDDSTFVHQAMDKLGFACEFSDLTVPEMSIVLRTAVCLRHSHQQEAKFWD